MGSSLAELNTMATVCEAVEWQSRRDPAAVAVRGRSGELTYAELWDTAGAIALRLKQLGIEHGGAVALLADPSPLMMAAILGAMRAGLAYVPLDAAHPDERLKYVLANSGARILMTDGSDERIVDVLDCVTLRLDDITPSTSTADLPDVGPSDAACIVYTSGTSGRPKGTVLTHGGVMNLAQAAVTALDLTPNDRFLQLAAATFSAFLEEVMPSFLAGGCLVMGGYKHVFATVDDFLQILHDERITSFEITTAKWHELVEAIDAGATVAPSLRVIIMGSEKANVTLLPKWGRAGVELVHVYGPTEASATVSYYHVPATLARAWKDDGLPIGYPILGVECHVLDEDLNHVEPGEEGELYVGGVGLAWGYINNPALTAESFIPNPFGSSGSRLYRTRDLVRMGADGALQFVGRRDYQVKIRGLRIELTEIEQVIRDHQSVHDCVVLANPTDDGELRLEAYVVLRTPTQANELRSHAALVLPSGMVPAVFWSVDELPLTPHGKVDRSEVRNLPGRSLDSSGSALDTDTQSRLAEIWKDVLGVEDLALQDSFFGRGGHSLSVVRMLARVAQEFGVRLELKQVFRSGTLGELAALVDEIASEHS